MTPEVTIAEHALAATARLGRTRLICIDGPSGSGKSTIARRIARLSPATLVRTDDLCPGWDGIAELPAILVALLTPLVEGQPGRFPRYDWILERTAEDLVVEPADVVIVEGVGAGALPLAPLTTTLVWVDADPARRRARALERDGEYFEAMWEPWAASEAAFFVSAGLPARADLRFDTSD